ncbi:MAG: WD40/YVTN/BNR-like repeat-containing protein [Polyangiales bacterium]
MKTLASLAVFSSTLAFVSVASANGRFPLANHLVQDPSDDQHIVVRTTYGIVQTTDHGKTWSWFCEQVPGYSGSFDPAVDVSNSGRLMVGLFDDLATSADRGCSFAKAGGILHKEYVIDLVVAGGKSFVLTSTGLGDAGFHVIVGESPDGATWTQAGVDLPADFNSETLEVAPSNLDRIYASGIVGVSPRTGVVERSDDHGKTWQCFTIDLKGAKAPYLGAVDATDPDKVYVRVDGDPDAAMPDKIADRLLASSDGGKTWNDVGGTKGDMLGFALSPDGTKIAYGGPKDGLWIASTSDFKFTRASGIQVQCLRWTKEGLFACASEFPDGFTVGWSKDDGKTFAPLHHLSEVTPLACTYGTCEETWLTIVRDSIGADAGADDAGSDASSGAEPPVVPPKDSSCKCSSVGRRNDVGAVAVAFGLLLAVRRRRRVH